MGVVVAILIAVLCVVGWLYRVAVRNSNLLTNYLMLVLLDEANYHKQSGNLRSLVADTSASDPLDLSTKVTLTTGQLISRQDAGKLAAAVAGLLWQLKSCNAPSSPIGPPSQRS